MPRVIAIDGPSGAGKSTISRKLADRLGFEFLDTGALYRAVAMHLFSLGFKEGSISESEIEAQLSGLQIFYKKGRIYIDGKDISDMLRTTEAGHYASVFSALKPVRDFLFDMQRRFADSMDIVAEGRDMTTVVFPEAWKKFYLDASVETRAQRRFDQLSEKGMTVTFEDANKDVIERDKRDMNREIAPLRIAEDAIYIDTTDIGIEEVVSEMMRHLG